MYETESRSFDRQERVRDWPWSCQCPSSLQWNWGCSWLYSCNHLYKSRMCSDGPADGCRPKREQVCLVAHEHLTAEIQMNYLFNGTYIVTTKRLWLINLKTLNTVSVAIKQQWWQYSDYTNIIYKNIWSTAHTYLKYEMMKSTLTFNDKSRNNHINNCKHTPLPRRHF